MIEHWKPIPGYEGFYEVSDFGQVKRIPGWVPGRRSRVHGGIIHLSRKGGNPEGYRRVSLCRKGVKRHFQVHRLVYEVFHGPIPSGHEPNHKNGKKHDNRLENLEAVTRSENQKHSYRVLGRVKVMLSGSAHRNAILTESVVLQMRELRKRGASLPWSARRKAGLTVQAIADKFGITYGGAYEAIAGMTWRHI